MFSKDLANQEIETYMYNTHIPFVDVRLIWKNGDMNRCCSLDYLETDDNVDEQFESGLKYKKDYDMNEIVHMSHKYRGYNEN